jgi:hypothetical protein
MARQSKRTPEDVAPRLGPRDAVPPPILPPSWTAAGLLLAFGDANPPLANYDQLVVANIAYDSTGGQPAMRVSLYLLEDLRYFDFLFTSGQWYWLVSEPGQAPTCYYGPFPTSLRAPSPDFLAQNAATYGNSWFIADTPTDGWVVPTLIPPGSDIPPHGTWFSMNSESGALWRVLNLDNYNPLNIPILGSYYLAYLPGFKPTGAQNLLSLVSGSPNSGNAPSAMASQRDIQAAMAKPLAVAPCTMAQIQDLIPGHQLPVKQAAAALVDRQNVHPGWDHRLRSHPVLDTGLVLVEQPDTANELCGIRQYGWDWHIQKPHGHRALCKLLHQSSLFPGQQRTMAALLPQSLLSRGGNSAA